MEHNSTNDLINFSLANGALSFDPFEACVSWIEKVLKIPISYHKNFRGVFANGVILCNLINELCPNSIRRINHSVNKLAANDNLSQFLLVCENEFKIPRSKLFTCDDFAGAPLNSHEECKEDQNNSKLSEKVAISIFWLAKAVEGLPNFLNLPKLNYSAFNTILPKSVIQASFCASKSDLVNVSIYSNGYYDSQLTNSNSVGGSDHIVNLSSRNNNMGTSQSTVSSSREAKTNIDQDNSIGLQSLDRLDSSQGNNNCFEEEEWQSKLDSWREKRRRATRQEATNLLLLQERENKEIERRKAETKDRLRQVKTQRSLLGNVHISPLELVPSPTINSPGVAILTGASCNLSQILAPDTTQPTTTTTNTTTSSAITNNVSVKNDYLPSKQIMETVNSTKHSSFLSGDNLANMDIKFKNQKSCQDDISLTNKHQVKVDSIIENVNSDNLNEVQQSQSTITSQDSESGTCILSSETKIQSKLSSTYRDFRDVKLRLSCKAGSTETRWGLTVRAEGPFETAPFIVQRIKMGSSADICDLLKGDVLVNLDGIDLGVLESTTLTRTCSESVTSLSDLEHLMDQLVLTNKPVTIHVLRKEDEFDFPNDGEPDIVEDYPLESPASKFTSTSPSNIVDADTDYREFDITPVTLSLTEGSQPQVIDFSSNLLQPMTTSHMIGETPSPNSLGLSTTSTRNVSPTSTISEADNIITPKLNIPLTKLATTTFVEEIKATPIINKIYQSNTGIDAPTDVGFIQLNTPSQSESTNLNGRTSRIQGSRHVEISHTEPTYLTLATISTTPSHSPQTIRRPIDAVKNTTTTIEKLHEKYSPKEYELKVIGSSSKKIASTPSYSSPVEVLTTSPTTPERLIHQQKRTFHINPKIPEVWNEIPLTHTVPNDNRQSEKIIPVCRPFSFFSEESKLPSPPPSSYFVCNTSPKPRHIQTTSSLNQPFIQQRPRQNSGSDIITSSRSSVISNPVPYYPSVGDCKFSVVSPESHSTVVHKLNVHCKSNPNLSTNYPKSDNTLTINQVNYDCDYSDSSMKINLPPAPVAPLPVPNLSELSHDFLYNCDQQTTDTEEIIIDDLDGLEKQPNVRKPYNKNFTSLPNFQQHTRNILNDLPLPPRMPRVRIVNLEQICAACNKKLGSEDSMVIESLNLYYHLPCFVCVSCGIALGDGRSDVEVRVRRNLLFCSACHSGNIHGPNGFKNRNMQSSVLVSNHPQTLHHVPVNLSDKRYHRGSEQKNSSGGFWGAGRGSTHINYV